MTDKFSYYTPEYMQDKKVSDLKSNPAFLQDGITFLKSDRRGYTDEDIKSMSADDVVSEVLEHFRYQTTNEVTVAKDLFFMNDKTVAPEQREAFGRLMFAFDNAKGEGLFDRGGEAIGDYFGGTVSAPTTYVSALAGVASAGTGAAAIQATKAASLAALRTAGKQAIKRSLMAGMADGAIGATLEYGSQKIRENVAEDIDLNYEVDPGAVALSGALGFAVGAGTYGAGAALQHRRAKRLIEGPLEKGRTSQAARLAEADAMASNTAKAAASDGAKRAKLEAATKGVLRSIDPNLVKEGDAVKKYLLSNDLPDGVVGGLSQDTIKRLSVASYELAERIGADISDPNVRITEVLADNIAKNKEAFLEVADQFGLSPRQLSAAYASEVSTAAKTMATQSAISKRAKRRSLEALSKKVDDLYAAGMAPAKAEDLAVINESVRDTQSVAWRSFKDLENARRMFMTSQMATTMRNNIFSGLMVGIDVVDQVNQAVLDTVFKGRKKGLATAKGTIDNLKYLTTDNYVADALVTMFHSQAPEKMQSIFFDAAVVEANVVKTSVLGKLGAAANTLNTMSDFVVKRAIITGSIDRQLRALGDDKLGNNVMDMLSKGTVDMLPDDMLEKAIDDALAFAFQRRFGGEGAGQLNKATGRLIQFIHNSGLTVLAPFPRYIASQAKFVSDYTGLTVMRRGFDATTQDYAKFMTGAMMFGGLYGIQKDNVLSDLEWYEAKGPDGKVYNAQAALGPLAPMAFITHQVARYTEGAPMKDSAALGKEFAKIMAGTEFRPGVGLIDKASQAFDAGNWEPLLNTVGDYFTSFTYPAAVLKDFYGQVDPRSAYLAETRDASMSMLDLWGKDVPLSVMQRVTRHLPDFDSDKISKQLEELTGITIQPSTLAKFLEFANSSTRTYYQTQYSKDADGKDMRQDAIRFDIFGDGPIRMTDPALKQLTGFVGKPPKNALQREITRLQIDPFKLYNPYKERNVTLEIFTQQLLQGTLAAKAELFMQTDMYKNATDEEKKLLLTSSKAVRTVDGKAEAGLVRSEISKARKRAREVLEGMSRMPEGKQDYEAYIRGEYRAMSASDNSMAAARWAKLSEKLGYKGLTFGEALATVDDRTDLTQEEKNVRKTSMTQYYIELAK
jgi:hypothetical protein